MKALLNGLTKSVELFKGADASVIATIFNDDGSVLDITGGAVDLVVYDRSDRYNTATATHAGDALTTPTAGVATITIADTELTYGPGEYYGFVKLTLSAKIYFSAPFVIVIR